ncbi:cytochrome P450 family protein [Thermobifida cellulosilytica]|uniref:Cytochrome P450 n=1 Tax=Thermobifida cellulosilytica TB100 TaxID=665004 RepID=A0A147KI95_THECS|nr:cytochrome P450 [Thermobifida cellulosilytica]KUP97001.1 cytochrome P450 [Thermobifida cellulosilytica TB100]
MSSPTGTPIALDPYVSDLEGERERLHEAGPIARVELPGGVLTWSVTHYQAARELLTDPRLSKNMAHWGAYHRGEISPTWPLLSVIPPTPTNLLGTDGAEHKRLRALTAQAFTPRRVEQLRPRIREITEELLDGLEKKAHEVQDLKSEFSFRLPMSVIGELYGVEEAAHGQLRGLYDKFFSSVTSPEDFVATREALANFYLDLMAKKKANPGDDLTTALLQANENGDSLTDEEVLGTLQIVVAAGHETTVNLLTNTVRALLRHSDQLELLRTGKATWEAAVEESLRWDPPTTNFIFRFATEDITYGDVTIAKGDSVMISYGAIGRDPSHHGENPEVFDITRSAGRHISFGYGPHVCPGAPLARLEAQVALPMLFERFPDMKLAVDDSELVPNPSVIVNSLREFPVVLRP